MNQRQVITPYAMNQIMLGLRTQLLVPGNPKYRLFQNDITPTPESVAADFTVATFDGYADKIFTMPSGPFRDVDGSFYFTGGGTWTMSGSTTPNVIYGSYVLDFTGANLIFAQRFDTPVPMVDAFSVIAIAAKVNFPRNGLTGSDLVY
jgi:hypothetical protein